MKIETFEKVLRALHDDKTVSLDYSLHERIRKVSDALGGLDMFAEFLFDIGTADTPIIKD